MKRSVVLVGGGIDSSARLLQAKREGYEPHALFLKYGQWSEAEQEAATKALCEKLDVHRVATKLDVQHFWPPQSVVFPVRLPGQDLLFLAHANALALMLDAEQIVMGATNGLYNKYMLDRPIVQPSIGKSFSTIVDEAADMMLDFTATYNCYRPKGPCGACDGCLARIAAFEDLGLVDPALYKPGRLRFS